jgi:predicted glycosyltransferase involved in capsule biosynthesis
MHDLKDVTFLIPIRVDQKERLRNLDILLRYLRKYLDTNIIVGETDIRQYDNGAIKNIRGIHDYTFLLEETLYLNRMKAINKLACYALTSVIVIQDTDVLLSPEQYKEAADKILSLKYELVYPYDGNFYNVPNDVVERINRDLCVDFVDFSVCTNMRPEGNSVGGIIFWDKKKFIECGGCNENFISWGFDDTEMYERAVKLDVKIDRCKKGLFHLSHKSSLNSLNGSHKYYKSNEQEWLKVKGMSKQQLLSYIESWRHS